MLALVYVGVCVWFRVLLLQQHQPSERITHKILITYACAFCDLYKEFEMSNVWVCSNVSYTHPKRAHQHHAAFLLHQLQSIFTIKCVPISKRYFHLSCDIVYTSRARFCNANTMIAIYFNICTFSCNLFVWKFFNSFHFRDNVPNRKKNSIINIKWNRKNNESTFSNSYKVKNQPNQIHVSNSNESNVYRMNVKEKWLNSAVLGPAVCCYFAKALCDWQFTLSFSRFLYFSFVLIIFRAAIVTMFVSKSLLIANDP